jgi:tetrahydromethanopterin S-methyltransferase subunit B
VGTVEERVAHVEGRLGEQAVMMEAIRQSVDRVDQRVVALEARMEQRFTAVDQRFAALDGRLSGLDAKMSRHFEWIVGVQLTALVAIIATILSAFFALK